MLTWMGPWDMTALAVFFLCWVGYTAFADHGPARGSSITASMNLRRRAWMHQATRRDLRIIDTQILGNLLTGVGFFSSTTIFVLGGLVAMLGVAEQGTAALNRLPLSVTQTAAAWEGKVLLLLLIFIYAFFKFAWAFRLANYCSILVGGFAAAEDRERDVVTAARNAETAATLSIRSGYHFNRGLRAYFFALAALGWLIGPQLFAVMTLLVVAVLYRREFRSRALEALRSHPPDMGRLDAS